MKAKTSVALITLLILLACTSMAHAKSDDLEVISGQALLRTVATGLVVAIDSGDTTDGLVDHVFFFQMEEGLENELSFDGKGTLLVRSDRLVLASEAGEQIADLKLRQDRRNDPRQLAKLGDSYRLAAGIGLSRYSNVPELTVEDMGGFDPLYQDSASWLGDNPLSKREIEIGGGGGGCAAGGPGSTSCSVSSCCSVSCGAGYYACCHCSNGCTCVADGGGGQN